MLWSLLRPPILVFDLALSLVGSTREECEQAALLPFADDPKAAHRIARDTGKICRQVARLLEESREAVGLPFLV